MSGSLPTIRRVGILAGWGRLPLVLADSLRREGCEVYCLGTIGHADPALGEVCNDFRWSGVAKSKPRRASTRGA